MEYWLIGQMLREGLDVYVPLVDDFGIDAVVRKQDNHFIEVQIKARSRTVKTWGRRSLCGDRSSNPSQKLLLCILFRSQKATSLVARSTLSWIAELGIEA